MQRRFAQREGRISLGIRPDGQDGRGYEHDSEISDDLMDADRLGHRGVVPAGMLVAGDANSAPHLHAVSNLHATTGCLGNSLADGSTCPNVDPSPYSTADDGSNPCTTPGTYSSSDITHEHNRTHASSEPSAHDGTHRHSRSDAGADAGTCDGNLISNSYARADR